MGHNCSPSKCVPKTLISKQLWGTLAVVCLRGGERGTCLGPPLMGAPLSCYTRKFSLFSMKNFLFSHIMYYQADHRYVPLLSKGPPTETVMCRDFAFKGAPNSNCNLRVICFQRGSQQPLKCVSTLLLNFVEGL